MKKTIECNHYKGSGFSYNLDDKTKLYLCECCNMNLAGEMAKQQAINTFAPTFDNDGEEE